MFSFEKQELSEVAKGDWQTQQVKILPNGFITIPVYASILGYQNYFGSLSFTTGFTARIKFEDIFGNQYSQSIDYNKGNTF